MHPAPPAAWPPARGARADWGARAADGLWAEGVRAYFAGAQGGEAAGAEALRLFEASLAEAEVDAARVCGCGGPGAAARLARRGLFCAGLLADAGRLPAAVARLRAAARADPELGEAHVELCSLLTGSGDPESARAAAAAAIVEGGLWEDAWQRPAAWLRGLPAKPWWDARDFAWAAELERRAADIRAEVGRLLGAGGAGGALAGSWEPVGGDHRCSGRGDRDALLRGDWREVVLFGLPGGSGERGRAAAPLTAGIVASVLPEAVRMAEAGAGEVVLSALRPGTRVAAHCARANHRLTAHLGIFVPAPAERGDSTPQCGIRVGGCWREWHEGRVIVFDDSFEHEVKNDAPQTRVVLLIRFWHPCLDTAARQEEALARIQAHLARSQRLHLLPPLAPDFREPGPALEAKLRGGGDCGRCERCGRDDLGGDLVLLEEPARAALVARCCGHAVE